MKNLRGELIDSYKTVKDWLVSLEADLSGSKGTRTGYLSDLARFCEWAKMDPDELIAERKSDLRGGDEDLEMRAEQRLKEYIVYLKKSGKAKNSVKRYVSSIRSFYRKVYPRGRIVSALPQGTKKSKTKAVEKQTILKVLNSATPLQRATILTIYQGMFRPITLQRMPGKIILEAIEREDPPVHIHVEEAWNKGEEVSYDTFLDSDAIEAIKSLRLTMKGKEPLFGRTDNIGRLVRDASKKAGLPSGVFSARVLRSSGASHMRTQNVPEAHVEEMQGHSQKYGGAYMSFSVEELRKSYEKGDTNIYGIVNGKVRVSQLNKAKKEFAELIYGLAKAMKSSGSPSMLEAIIQICEEARELRQWDPLEESTPIIEVLKDVVSGN